MNVERQIKKLEDRITHLEATTARALKVARRISNRCTSLLNNQKHYLRHRAPTVLKRQKRMLANAERLTARLQAIPGIKHVTTQKTAHGSKTVRHLLLVSGNEARKLRALAHIDLRSILNTVSNRGKKRREILGYTNGNRKSTR
jgi:hypothetical protein